MSTKVQVVSVLVAFIVGVAVGRGAVPVKVTDTEKRVVDTAKTEVVKSDLNRDKHRETTVTETVAPDGVKTTVTKTVEDTKTDKDVVKGSTEATRAVEEKSHVAVAAGAKVTVSFLAGVPVTGPYSPVYGLSITKPVLGPITLGLWGFTSQVAGFSLGLTF